MLRIVEPGQIIVPDQPVIIPCAYTDKGTSTTAFGSVVIPDFPALLDLFGEPDTVEKTAPGDSFKPHCANANVKAARRLVLIYLEKGMHRIFAPDATTAGSKEVECIVPPQGWFLFGDFKVSTAPPADWKYCYPGHSSSPRTKVTIRPHKSKEVVPDTLAFFGQYDFQPTLERMGQ